MASPEVVGSNPTPVIRVDLSPYYQDRLMLPEYFGPSVKGDSRLSPIRRNGA